MENPRLCVECGMPIAGRTDKKFCTDQCRTSYNNRVNSDASNYMRSVNRTLRKNRRILFELNPSGKVKVHRKKLQALGFNFKFVTNLYTTRAGAVYYFCYDQGYLPLEEDFFMIVEREEYVD